MNKCCLEIRPNLIVIVFLILSFFSILFFKVSCLFIIFFLDCFPCDLLVHYYTHLLFDSSAAALLIQNSSHIVGIHIDSQTILTIWIGHLKSKRIKKIYKYLFIHSLIHSLRIHYGFVCDSILFKTFFDWCYTVFFLRLVVAFIENVSEIYLYFIYEIEVFLFKIQNILYIWKWRRKIWF